VNARRWRVVVLTAVLVIAFVLLLASGIGNDPRDLPSELASRRAPSFSLPSLTGDETVSSADLRGQAVVLNFWASWCVPCREEHGALDAAWDRYRERGVVVLGVNVEDARPDALEYVEEVGGSWPLVTDPGSRTSIAFGRFGVPETFVIAPDGTIVAKMVGAVTYEWLVDKIEGALRSEATS
jgi:cytochrome c biogenesis protein CcmG, thiol:disulfide interchange protein DsbE